MKVKEITNCLRCKSNYLLNSFPITHCQNCHMIMMLENNHRDFNGQLKSVKFFIEKYHIYILSRENKTFINGRGEEIELNSALPFDITKEKLKTYLTFS